MSVFTLAPNFAIYNPAIPTKFFIKNLEALQMQGFLLSVALSPLCFKYGLVGQWGW